MSVAFRLRPPALRRLEPHLEGDLQTVDRNRARQTEGAADVLMVDERVGESDGTAKRGRQALRSQVCSQRGPQPICVVAGQCLAALMVDAVRQEPSSGEGDEELRKRQFLIADDVRDEFSHVPIAAKRWRDPLIGGEGV